MSAPEDASAGLAGCLSAGGDNTRAAAVSPLTGPRFARRCCRAARASLTSCQGFAGHRTNQQGDPWRDASPALVSSGVESPRPLLTFLGGLGRLHNWRLSQSPIFALCFSSKGPGQLPGRGRAGTAAIQVAGVHLQLRGTHLGRNVRPSCQAVTPTPLNLQTWVTRIALELCRPGWTRTPELLLPLPPE